MISEIPGTTSPVTIRAVVFKEAGLYVGQCLELDIAAQADNIPDLLDRLDTTLMAELAECVARRKPVANCISQAPECYQRMWEERTVMLEHAGDRGHAPGNPTIQAALAG